MPAEPLFLWSDVVREWLGFVSAYLAVGAVGFRYAALRGPAGRLAPPAARAALARAASTAAWLGLAGAAVQLALLAQSAPELAARAHLSTSAYLRVTPAFQYLLAGWALALVGLTLASAHRWFGWRLAAIGVVAVPLRGAVFGTWPALVNPLHLFAGGLWIGTLFVLVVAGLGAVLGGALAPDERGAAAEALVRAFSPVALGAAALLAVTGVITAWRHLHRLPALWTTPYGVTLCLKLALVAVVLAVAAWNWRRATPRMGSEAGARALRRSAALELSLVAIVLAVTGVLVSLPSPPR